jgi:hypothetical protein
MVNVIVASLKEEKWMEEKIKRIRIEIKDDIQIYCMKNMPASAWWGEVNRIDLNLKEIIRESSINKKNIYELLGETMKKMIGNNHPSIILKKDLFDGKIEGSKKNETAIIKTTSPKLCFVIPTYDRYESLAEILKELYSKPHNHSVIVADDGSPQKNQINLLKKKYKKTIFIRNEVNNGKKGYWKTFNIMLNEAKKNGFFSHLIQIDDDFRLCGDFVKKMEELSRQAPNKFVKYIRDNSYGEKRWGYDMWVDGGTMIPFDFLKRTLFRVDPIHTKRWQHDPTLSSGVWTQITKKLNYMGYSVIHTDISYALHMGNDDSKMNPNLRKKIKIETVNFIDGNNDDIDCL